MHLIELLGVELWFKSAMTDHLTVSFGLLRFER